MLLNQILLLLLTKKKKKKEKKNPFIAMKLTATGLLAIYLAGYSGPSS
jgi:hypothetical protein